MDEHDRYRLVKVYTPEPETLCSKINQCIYYNNDEKRNYDRAFELLEQNSDYKFGVDEITQLIQHVIFGTGEAKKMRNILFDMYFK